jgi:hypothetical protein
VRCSPARARHLNKDGIPYRVSAASRRSKAAARLAIDDAAATSSPLSAAPGDRRRRVDVQLACASSSIARSILALRKLVVVDGTTTVTTR